MTVLPAVGGNDSIQMSTARLWSTQSTCTRAQVGAVLAVSGRTIGTGYNGAPPGVPHCSHNLPYVPNIQGRDSWSRRISPVPAHRTEPGCRISTHAEANALAYAARHGIAVGGGTLFVTLSPCYACAQLIIAAGLIRVVYDQAYRDPEGIRLLDVAGITVEKWIE